MPLPLAILDACVLFPAALRDTLLRAAEAEFYTIRWSEQILEEVRRNLVASGRVDARRAARLIGAMRRSFPEAAVTDFETLVNRMTNHKNDRHVLAAAVAAGATVIVTHNVRHFPRRALEPFNVRAASPEQFLLGLFVEQPDAMVAIVQRQAADLQAPPMTVEEILEDLALHAPRFATALRSRIAAHHG